MSHSLLHWLLKFVVALVAITTSQGVAYGVVKADGTIVKKDLPAVAVCNPTAERAAGDIKIRSLKRMFQQQQLQADQFYERMRALLSERS